MHALESPDLGGHHRFLEYVCIYNIENIFCAILKHNSLILFRLKRNKDNLDRGCYFIQFGDGVTESELEKLFPILSQKSWYPQSEAKLRFQFGNAKSRPGTFLQMIRIL